MEHFLKSEQDLNRQTARLKWCVLLIWFEVTVCNSCCIKLIFIKDLSARQNYRLCVML